MKVRNVIIFMVAFLFINAIGIYVVGGFYNQTIKSKAIIEFIAIAFAIIITAADVESRK